MKFFLGRYSLLGAGREKRGIAFERFNKKVVIN